MGDEQEAVVKETPIPVVNVWAWCLCCVGYAMWCIWWTEERWRQQDRAAWAAELERMFAESRRLGDWRRAHGQRR